MEREDYIPRLARGRMLPKPWPQTASADPNAGKGKPYCKNGCRYHVRGPNHEEGSHHAGTVTTRTRTRWR